MIMNKEEFIKEALEDLNLTEEDLVIHEGSEEIVADEIELEVPKEFTEDFVDMKRQGKNNFNGRNASRFRTVPVMSGTGAMSVDYIPARKKLRKKYASMPHLEKIGGMDEKVRNFITRHCDLSDGSTSVIRTSLPESVQQLPTSIRSLVNLKRVNDIAEINRFFYAVNLFLPEGGLFIAELNVI